MSRPSQSEMVLPLLDALELAGGSLSARDACDAVAESLKVPANVRDATVEIGGQRYRAWDRDVRWAQQRAKLAGLIDTSRHGHWRVTGKGAKTLHEAVPGVVITVLTTRMGNAHWAASSASVAERRKRTALRKETRTTVEYAIDMAHGNPVPIIHLKDFSI